MPAQPVGYGGRRITMPIPNTLDICRTDLFTAEMELQAKGIPDIIIQRIIRIRSIYLYLLSNPDLKDRQLIDEMINRFGIEKTAAYNDLAIIKNILPAINSATRDFHRWRYNEMILETFQMAKKRKDTKTMERAATSYAKFNRVDTDDDNKLPFDLIVVQPFVPTLDPSVLGIKPIPNIQEKISKMIEKYSAESMDIEDVSFEEADLEEDELFEDEETTEEQ